MRQTMMGSAGTASRSATNRLRPRVEWLEGRTLLSAGDLDLSFGGTGSVVTSVGSLSTGDTNFAMGLAVQADGKTVEVGTVRSTSKGVTREDAIVLRYRVDGTPDPTFGTNGRLVISTLSNVWGSHFRPFSIAIQPSDGKIVIAGNSRITFGKGKSAITRSDLLLVRLTSNGSLDPTFDGDGQATLDLPAVGDLFASGVAIQVDGRIVVAGGHPSAIYDATDDAANGFLVARWTPSGQLDTSFGPGGRGYNLRPTGAAHSMAIDPSGRILVGGQDIDAGTGTGVNALVRYTSDGLVDTSFGTNGEIALGAVNPHRGVTGIGFQSGGKVIASGVFFEESSGLYIGTVARVNADGSLDAAFGSGGYFQDHNLASNYGLVVQPDGAIVMAGFPRTGDSLLTNTFGIDRILPGGESLDPSFGDLGLVRVTFPGGSSNDYQIPYSAALGPDGKITAAGVVRYANPASFNFGTVRLLNDVTSAVSVAGSSAAARLARDTGISTLAATPPAFSMVGLEGVKTAGEVVALLIAEPPQSGPMPFMKKFRFRR